MMQSRPNCNGCSVHPACNAIPISLHCHMIFVGTSNQPEKISNNNPEELSTCTAEYIAVLVRAGYYKSNAN